MADEVKYFARSAVFAVGIGIVYWAVSYEWAGTVLLIAFGLAASFATTILFSGSRGFLARGGAGPDDTRASVVTDIHPNGPFGDESGRLPAPTLAPLFVGLGAGVGAMSLAFGVWFALIGAVIALPGVASWFAAALREASAVAADDDQEAQEPGATPGRGAFGSGSAEPDPATGTRLGERGASTSGAAGSGSPLPPRSA